jgi:CBS domain containing-hemolysin-like protein
LFPFSQGHQYETVSGFVCEAFGYIPKTGESVTVVLEKENWEENDEQDEGKHERQDQKEKHQIYRLEVHGFIVLLPLAPHS